MNDKSLEVALDEIIHCICRLNIDEVDKIELLINLRNFLSTDKYRHNIEVLSDDYSTFNNKLRN